MRFPWSPPADPEHEHIPKSRYLPRNLPPSGSNGRDWMLLTDLDGVPFYDATVPPANHRCWAQTIAWTGKVKESRCPCGGHRIDNGRWNMKNARRS